MKPIHGIRVLLLALLAFCFACSAQAPEDESVGETKQALCANYPTYGAGDGDGSGAISGGWTGFVTKVRPSPAYSDKLEVTHAQANGVTSVGHLNFGALPVGAANIKFLPSAGWTGSYANKLTKIRLCWPTGHTTPNGWCDNQTASKTCEDDPDVACLFLNDVKAIRWNWLRTVVNGVVTNPGGSIIPNSTMDFPLGVTGIWGTAPNEPSHFRIFALSSGGPGSYSTRWTFANSATCP